MSNEIWVEKYRPRVLDDVIINENTLNKFREFIDEKDIPHLLFSGDAGIGKTTVAKILANSITDEILYINASDKSSIDVIRTDVTNFCSMLSFSESNIKIIILDEFDGITIQAQKAIRGVMEEFASNSRFILTCNMGNSVLPAIHSRCQSFNFGTGSVNEVAKRCVKILKDEGINFIDKKKDIKLLVKKHFPDIRKTINDLQKCCTNGTFSYLDEIISLEEKDRLIELIKEKDTIAIRTELLGAGADYTTYYKTIFNRMGELVDDEDKVSGLIMTTEYMNQHPNCLVPEMNFISCILHICMMNS